MCPIWTPRAPFWCEVTGIDYVPALLRRGRERAAAEGLQVTFQEGDAEALPFPDASCDVVLSAFGAMFAPDQEQTARELLRVCRPGGKIGMLNWTPDSFVGVYFADAMIRYVPPPPGLKPPVLWGTEARVRELCGDAIASLHVTWRSFVFRYRSPEHWLEVFRSTMRPVLKAFESLDAQSQEQMARDLIAVVNRLNRSGDQTMVVSSDYLEVVVTKC